MSGGGVRSGTLALEWVALATSILDDVSLEVARSRLFELVSEDEAVVLFDELLAARAMTVVRAALQLVFARGEVDVDVLDAMVRRPVEAVLLRERPRALRETIAAVSLLAFDRSTGASELPRAELFEQARRMARRPVVGGDD